MYTCPDCNRTLPAGDFQKDKTQSRGYDYYCRPCRKIRKDQVKISNHTFVLNYFRENPCVDCGCDDILCLDFDHLGNKEWEISRMLTNNVSVNRLKAEVSKCESRCRNCHARKTHKDQNTYRWKAHLSQKIIDRS